MKIKRQVLKKIILEALQEECGMAHPPGPVATPTAPPGGHSGAPEPTDLADMSPSEAFGFAWTKAIEHLQVEFPEAAASLESLSGGGSPPAT